MNANEEEFKRIAKKRLQDEDKYERVVRLMKSCMIDGLDFAAVAIIAHDVLFEGLPELSAGFDLLMLPRRHWLQTPEIVEAHNMIQGMIPRFKGNESLLLSTLVTMCDNEERTVGLIDPDVGLPRHVKVFCVLCRVACFPLRIYT